MPFLRRLSTFVLVLAAAALLALGWIAIALAETDGDDGFDGGGLGLPIVLGIGLLAFLGWMALRRRPPKSPN